MEMDAGFGEERGYQIELIKLDFTRKARLIQGLVIGLRDQVIGNVLSIIMYLPMCTSSHHRPNLQFQ